MNLGCNKAFHTISIEIKPTMTYLLHIQASPMGDNSKSKAVASEFLKEYKTAHPKQDIITKDLYAIEVPHIDAETLTAGYIEDKDRSESMRLKHQRRIDFINELINASAIVVSTPMWNWTIPSVLKAYIDHIVMPGKLDPYGNKHLANKAVTIIIAAGGSYGPDSAHPEWDFESAYLRHIFTSLGATDIHIIRTEHTIAGAIPGTEGLIPKKEESHQQATISATTRARLL